MKRLNDYLTDADNHVNGLHVGLELIQKSPKGFLPYAILFALFVEGTVRLSIARADWIAYVALVLGTLAFVSLITLLTKRKRSERKK